MVTQFERLSRGRRCWERPHFRCRSWNHRAQNIVQEQSTTSLRYVQFLIKSYLLTNNTQKGIAINNDCTQAAIGGNDNSCSIWNIENLSLPRAQFLLPHDAAVKAVAFCPWTRLLLATGGGLKDRKIRFWHTNSGTLLGEYQTDSQITSLVWNQYKREIAATFGFRCGPEPLLVCVYSYPSMVPTGRVPSPITNVRTLGSAASPDGQSLAVVVNDTTIRIYQMWTKTRLLQHVSSSSTSSSYGSLLIELNEGVTRTDRPFR